MSGEGTMPDLTGDMIRRVQEEASKTLGLTALRRIESEAYERGKTAGLESAKHYYEEAEPRIEAALLRETAAQKTSNDYYEALEDARAETKAAKADYEGACKTIADMHAAAVGEVRGPKRGVVEDVAALRKELRGLQHAVFHALDDSEVRDDGQLIQIGDNALLCRLVPDEHPEPMFTDDERKKVIQECADAIRDHCEACDGTGHESSDPEASPGECEYCGRPRAALLHVDGEALS